MSLEISFHHDVYDEQALRDSAEAFGGLASITVAVAEAGGAYTVRFSDIQEEARDAIEDEFCNHALAGTIRTRRARVSE